MVVEQTVGVGWLVAVTGTTHAPRARIAQVPPPMRLHISSNAGPRRVSTCVCEPHRRVRGHLMILVVLGRGG